MELVVQWLKNVTWRTQLNETVRDTAYHLTLRESVRVWSFSGPYFPAFGLNTDQKISDYEHFSRSVIWRWFWIEIEVMVATVP